MGREGEGSMGRLTHLMGNGIWGGYPEPTNPSKDVDPWLSLCRPNQASRDGGRLSTVGRNQEGASCSPPPLTTPGATFPITTEPPAALAITSLQQGKTPH